MALIKITGIHSTLLRSSFNLSYHGQRLYAMGFPESCDHLALSQGKHQFTAALNNLDPGLKLMNHESPNRELIQINLKTLPSNSGSPIVNRSGNLVGVADLSNSKNVTQGIPSHELNKLIFDYRFNKE